MTCSTSLRIALRFWADRRLVSAAAEPVQELGKVPVVQPGLARAAEHIDFPGPGILDVNDELLGVVGSELVSCLVLLAGPCPGECRRAQSRQRGRRGSCSGGAAKYCPPGRALRSAAVILRCHGIPLLVLVRHNLASS